MYLVLLDYQGLGIAQHKAPGCKEHPLCNQRAKDVGTCTAHAQWQEDPDTSEIIAKQKYSIYQAVKEGFLSCADIKKVLPGTGPWKLEEVDPSFLELLDTCRDHVIHNIHVSSKLRNWTRIISLTAIRWRRSTGVEMSSRRGHSSSSNRYSSSSRRSPRRDSYGSSRYNSSGYDSYGGGGFRDKKRYLKKKLLLNYAFYVVRGVHRDHCFPVSTET